MSQRKNLTTDKKNTHIFKAPLCGMVYLAPSPTDKPFVEVGQEVKAGDTICLIETMKMFAKITADRDGVITERHADNSTIIYANNPLFTMQVPLPKIAALFSLINEAQHRTNLSAHEKNLVIKLNNLKAFLTENPMPDFEDCAGVLHSAISSAFRQDQNISSTLNALDTAWMQYWNGIADTYSYHVRLKDIIVGLFAILGAVAGAIIGIATVPVASPLSVTAGLAAGTIAGSCFGNWLADCCFFSHSKDKLDAAVKFSGKISEIKDNIGMVSACRG